MILVTGGTGHLGSHVIYELVKNNHPVRATYRKKENQAKTREIFSYYEQDEQAFNRIEWVEADMNDFYAVSGSLSGVSLVFHTAGQVSFKDSERDILSHINTEGTANIVNACLESDLRLCYVSSVATLGEQAGNLPVNENTFWNPGNSVSAYSRSKYLAEMEVWRGIYEGLKAVIVNPSVIIGPGMWLGPGKDLWNSIAKGLIFYPEGSTGYIDVRDVAALMVKLTGMEMSGERFILTSENMTYFDFISLLAQGLDVKKPYVKVTPFIIKSALVLETIRSIFTGKEKRINRRAMKISAKRLLYSGEKIRALTGFNFIPVSESVRSAAEIYKKQVSRKI